MRKNTENVFKAWANGRSNKSQKSIWTDGIHVYSYNTVILVKPDEADAPYRFNTNRYSRTTSCHQNAIKLMLDRNNISYTLHGL